MSKWRRPATRTYDYNFKLGEHYYKPQLDYLETRKGRAKSPPTAKTFAERFAEDPIYGHGNYSRRKPLSSAEDDMFLNQGESSSLSSMRNKFASMDDLAISSRKKVDMDFSSEFGGGSSGPLSPRLVVGDRILDSIGIQETKLSQPLAQSLSLAQSESQSSSTTTKTTRRAVGARVGFVQSADADISSEDPFIRQNAKLLLARKHGDSMMEDMKAAESDSSVSRFRAKIAARKEERANALREEVVSAQTPKFYFSDDDDETAALQSKINKIGERARARLAQLDEEFPDIEIGSALATRRAGTKKTSWADEGDDSYGASSNAASRSLKITKRTVKASYESE